MSFITLDTSLCLGKKPEIELSRNCWIAGGSVRRWFTGEKQDSDIDIFSKHEDYLRECIEKNKLSGLKQNETKNAISITKDGVVYQFIKFYSETPNGCIDKFDFKHCMFAWEGQEIISTSEAIICSFRKRLMVHNIQLGFEVDTLRRAFKYQRQGYTPCNGTIMELAKCFTEIKLDEIEAQAEMSPAGGKRILRFD